MRKLASLAAVAIFGALARADTVPHPQRTINPAKRNSSEIGQWNAKVEQRKADRQDKRNDEKRKKK